jgi:putative membrane protein
MKTANALQPIDSKLTRPIIGLIAVWVLAMISVPILRWTWGEDAVIVGLNVGVLLQIAAVLAALWRAWGAKKTAVVLVTVPLIAWLSEYVGHNTGFPFGAYHYTERLQPQLGGVPILVPLAWLMMLPPAWAMTALILRGKQRRWVFAAVSALVFTAWDLFLDPQMVAWDLWRWMEPGAFSYFGIPWVNFAGWLLVSFAMTMVVSLVVGINRLPIMPLSLIYIVTWLLQSIGHLVFWGLPGSGLIGAVVMGCVIWLAGRSGLRAVGAAREDV